MISTKSSKAEYLISMCEILLSGIVGSNILKLNSLTLGCALVHPPFLTTCLLANQPTCIISKKYSLQLSDHR